MNNWSEIRTAYHVARLGTVSAAAKYLGVHRATVIRHIDALETELGKKIFLRHLQGYTPTEVGLDLMRVAQTTDEQFSQLLGRTKGRGVELSGEFTVTSLYIFAPMLIPVLNAFQAQHPNIVVRYMDSDRLFRLDYGEAHIAIRVGKKPNNPNLVVQPFTKLKIGLYASKDYVLRRGMPKTSDDFVNHSFVGHVNPKFPSPFNVWMRNNIPETSIIFQSNSRLVLNDAILSGIGIGFFATYRANQHSNLIEIWEHQNKWDIQSWLITHVDLHHVPKVKAFLKLLDRTQLQLNSQET
ncbi:MAG: LysR family transcriptional regulator [Cyanobacteria bacterium J06631_2]